MFRFTIRDLLWLMLAIAVIAGMYWNQQHQPEAPKVQINTVEVTVEPDGSTTTKTFDR
ncbi:MAG TPA: hypothetical protein VGI40_21180 [Pirellulaceae bacterium]|jgi:outer membrane biosynthesis protein TonB